ncbi:hypothetical protein [Calothrix sp. 336/3]|nr:hypothetical protein [Calothrix sp. 336/3]
MGQSSTPIIDILGSWQDWVTVFAYLGLTVFVIWGILSKSGK